jgi:hypothetical protein
VKTFRRWLQVREATDLWQTQGEPGDDPTPKSKAAKNRDLYNKKFGVGGSGVGIGAASGGAQGMFAGTGPGMGGMHPVRMKKMKT